MERISACLNLELDTMDECMHVAILKATRKKLSDYRGNVLKALKKEFVSK